MRRIKEMKIKGRGELHENDELVDYREDREIIIPNVVSFHVWSTENTNQFISSCIPAQTR